MAMLDYLHGVYPKVHISLHAGEIVMGLVPPEDLTFHIRASIEKGHAERIGHGVDVMNERGPLDLLKEMAARDVLVEISLTSNDMILGVTGDDQSSTDLSALWSSGGDLDRRRGRGAIRHDA
jgi:adenosine deaminase